MTLKTRFILTLAATAALSGVTVTAGPVSPGDVVGLVATSNAANNTTGALVDVTPGVASQSISISDSVTDGVNGFRFSGSATSNGYLSHTDDYSRFVFTGHNDSAGTANVNTITARRVGVLSATGAVSVAAGYTGASGNQARSATSIDGSTFYIADQGGIYTNGSTSASPTANVRGIKSFGGTVYTGAASTTLIQVSTVSAPSGGSITGLLGLTTNSNLADFYFVSSGSNGTVYDVLYTLSSTSATAGTISKYSLASGSWTSNGSITETFGGFGFAAMKSGTGAVLFASTGSGATAANSIVSLQDTAGYNATISLLSTTPAIVYTATGTNTIKGIDVLVPEPASIGVWLVGGLLIAARRRRTPA